MRSRAGDIMNDLISHLVEEVEDDETQGELVFDEEEQERVGEFKLPSHNALPLARIILLNRTGGQKKTITEPEM